MQTPELLGKPLELKAPIDGVIIDRKERVGRTGRQRQGNLHDQRSDRSVGDRGSEGARHRRGESRPGRELHVLAYPGETFHGKVVRIGNEVEAESRTVEARIEVNNPTGV